MEKTGLVLFSVIFCGGEFKGNGKMLASQGPLKQSPGFLEARGLENLPNPKKGTHEGVQSHGK